MIIHHTKSYPLSLIRSPSNSSDRIVNQFNLHSFILLSTVTWRVQREIKGQRGESRNFFAATLVDWLNEKDCFLFIILKIRKIKTISFFLKFYISDFRLMA